VPLLQDIDLKVSVDEVIRSQGADPKIIRGRNPHLVKVAEKALEEGLPFLKPQVLYREFTVDSLRHETLSFCEGGTIKGKLVAQHMAAAEKVVIILCTVGPTLEKNSGKLVSTNPVAGLALEGVGSAAVEAIANAACNYFENRAKENGLNTTIPLSPGMVGWPVDEGQPQIFTLLDAVEIGVELTPSYLMLPRKSLSFAIGIGSNVLVEGTTCDYCTMKDTCQYQNHYAPSPN